FRLIDALLLRPLPVAHPERLYVPYHQGLGFNGKPQTFDGWAYPVFRQIRPAVKDQAELIAVSNGERSDVAYGSDQEMEKANLQYVSGWMFTSFGLRPAIGRLFTENDDRQPGAHPYAVLSHDYWTRRFGQDTKVIGRTFRLGDSLYEIVGVAEERFTGTEPGTVTSIFLPTMMHRAVGQAGNTWARVFLQPKPGADLEPIRQKLQAIGRAFEADGAKGYRGIPKQSIDNFINQQVLLKS